MIYNCGEFFLCICLNDRVRSVLMMKEELEDAACGVNENQTDGVINDITGNRACGLML